MHVQGRWRDRLTLAVADHGARQPRHLQRILPDMNANAIACLGLVLLVAGCARAPEPSSGDLVTLEHQWVAAIEHHDTARLDAILDDSFLDSTFRGDTRTKAQFLTGPRAAGKYHSIDLDDLKVRRYGDSAVVTGVNVLRGDGADDIVRVRFTDVFHLRDGRWRAVSAQETLQMSHPPG